MTDEAAFLAAILERPDDDATKLVYADWLEEQGDPRAEYLRGIMEVRQKRTITPEQRQRHEELSRELAALRNEETQAILASSGAHSSSREERGRRRRIEKLNAQFSDLSKQIRQPIPARLQELAAMFDPRWLAVVSDAEIEGCGKSAENWLLRFEFVCDKTWADLMPTDDRTIRQCEACNRSVHYCDNLADARQHSRSGHCIALDLGVIRRDGDLQPRRDSDLRLRAVLLGAPSRESLRKRDEEDLDPVSQARLNARRKK